MDAQDQVKVGMPLAQFLEEANERPFELINGEKVEKMPSGWQLHAKIITWLYRSILQALTCSGSGEVLTAVTFILPDAYDSNWVRGSREPDVMAYVGDRIAQFEATLQPHDNRPLSIVPDFVIEVISPTDGATEVENKIAAYMQDGVRLLWVIYPESRKIRIFRTDGEYRETTDSGTLDAGEIIPGWSITLDDLFGAKA